MTHTAALTALTKEIEAVVDETRDLFTSDATTFGEEMLRLGEVDAKLETLRRDHTTPPNIKVKIMRNHLALEIDRLEFAAEETSGITADLRDIITDARTLWKETAGLES